MADPTAPGGPSRSLPELSTGGAPADRGPAPAPRSRASVAREDRLAAALRANLRRRKARPAAKGA